MKQKENFVTFCNDIVQYCHPMQSDKCLHFGKSNNDRKGSQNAHWPRKISKIVKFYKNPSIKGSEAQKQRPDKFL